MQKAIPKFHMLTEEQMKYIHNKTLELLRRVGVEVYNSDALEVLKKNDSTIVKNERVYFDPGLIEWAIKTSPSRVALCERGSEKVIAGLEGKSVNFGTGSDCLHYLDPKTRERRPFEDKDIIDCIRVVDAMPELQFCMSMGIPSDPGPHPYREQFSMMIENTTKPIVFTADDREDCKAIIKATAVVAGGKEQLRLNPSILLYSEPSSPLRHSDSALGKLLLMSEYGLPVVYSPAPVQGGTAPVTLGGAIAMANAEVLSGLATHQLTNTGSPFVYGFGMHHMDMKTTISVYTSPEFLLARVAAAELGRFYDMPTWGYAGDSNSCTIDEQAASESSVSIMGALLAGNDLTHDVGYLESGKTTSPEMIVLSNEIISMIRSFVEGFSLDEESFALDSIIETGPGGGFLRSSHTRNNFQGLWEPSLFSREDGESWVQKGKKSLNEVVQKKTLDILNKHKVKPLPNDVKNKMNQILECECK